MQPRKILLDTDIGDDIDDAFALALCARMQSLELVGVTTVFRNTADRAQLVARLTEDCGKTVPIVAGERLPIKEPIHVFNKDDATAPELQHVCQWSDAYADYPVNEGAVDYIIDMVKQYGSELTIVPIGPMTNIARAIQKAPEVMRTVGSIVEMGGWFTNYVPEWNILCDPEAADIVWSSGIPVYAVGLDVTLQCTLDESLLGDFRSSDLAHNKRIVEWLDKWFAFFNFDKSVMHDPLAVVSVTKPVCSFEKRYVKVDLTDKRGAAQVSNEPMEGYSPIFVATAVDKQLFYETVRSELL